MRICHRVLICLLVFVCSVSVAFAAVEPLQVGDRSDEVLAVQKKLSDLGYIVGSMDGVYGEVTAEAVRSFEKDKGLKSDGVVSPELFKALIGRDLPVSRDSSSTVVVRRLIRDAMQYVGVPYWFGGTTPRGFDCSGFTRYVFSGIGIELPRMADAQYYNVGRPVPAERLQPGDLVFFETYEAGPSHVGIYVGNDQFISATSSRGIQVTGLYDSYWGPRFIGARRVV